MWIFFLLSLLDGRSHISLVDIRIPEEETKSFTFTDT